jgi:tetratricopeptide (TPR) repeat protein
VKRADSQAPEIRYWSYTKNVGSKAMKTRITYIFILIILVPSCSLTGTKNKNDSVMQNRFFTKDEFNKFYGKEMVSSQDVYESMKKNGLKDYQFCHFDFNFISDSKEKLDSLSKFLIGNYSFKINSLKKLDNHWDLAGDAIPFPVDSDNIMYWALDLYLKGFQFDCRLDGYGAIVEKPVFPDLTIGKDDYYFSVAMKAYNNHNTGLAIIHWSTALKINPNDPNSYYSRAIAKNELYTWKAALRDYDKAIELAPKFVDAYINRGSVKDENGEFEGAISDYDKAIELQKDNAMAYFNRGNAKFNIGNKKGACLDWQKAKDLGAIYADERLKQQCK